MPLLQKYKSFAWIHREYHKLPEPLSFSETEKFIGFYKQQSAILQSIIENVAIPINIRNY